MILCLDELDMDLTAVLNGKVVCPPDFHIEVSGKPGWGTTADYLAQLAHVYVIATSNKPLSWWDEESRAFATRPGRFMGRHEMSPLTEDQVVQVYDNGRAAYGVTGERAASLPRAATIASLSQAFRAAQFEAGGGRMDAAALNRALAGIGA
jgi:hypothetical protein